MAFSRRNGKLSCSSINECSLLARLGLSLEQVNEVRCRPEGGGWVVQRTPTHPSVQYVFPEGSESLEFIIKPFSALVENDLKFNK